MNEGIQIYTHDFRILIPVIAMFIIIFAIVLRSLNEMPIFQGGTKLVVAFCVSFLAIFGLDQGLIRPILLHYTAMGIAMLISLVIMLLAAWIVIIFKTGKKP